MGENRKIILFDGVCNLCSWAVNFIIDHDPQGKFLFASLQSDIGQQLLQRAGHPNPEALDSVVLIEDGQWFAQSEAAVKIARHLSFPITLFKYGRLIPTPLRDSIYQWISRNRYRWFGKQEACQLPSPELKARFL